MKLKESPNAQLWQRAIETAKKTGDANTKVLAEHVTEESEVIFEGGDVSSHPEIQVLGIFRVNEQVSIVIGAKFRADNRDLSQVRIRRTFLLSILPE